MDVTKIKIEDFNYELPNDRIAYEPLLERDASKLLVYKKGLITNDTYKQIANYIPENALMVFNDTKVIQARLFFTKESGAVIEIFILEPYKLPIASAMQQKQTIEVTCLIGGASKWKTGQILEKELIYDETHISLYAKFINKTDDAFVVALSWNNEMNFAEIVALFGNMPLPPYIKRKAAAIDDTRYQTIYAKHNGSVAAPTAGLHFTENIFDNLKAKMIDNENITLHVGAGTFKPVSSATMANHIMHQEYCSFSISFLQKLLHSQNIVAVGTTSARTIETIYWLGVKVTQNLNITAADLKIQQWDAYELEQIDKHIAIEALINWMLQNNYNEFFTQTQLLIAPTYQFKIVNILVTNFHQPKSTLLLLVAAATNGNWKTIYNHALANDYRFLSYGDGCLLFLGR